MIQYRLTHTHLEGPMLEYLLWLSVGGEIIGDLNHLGTQCYRQVFISNNTCQKLCIGKLLLN